MRKMIVFTAHLFLREHTVTVHVLERDAGNRSLKEENLGLQVDPLGVALDDVEHASVFSISEACA